MFYKDANGVVLVCHITHKISFEELQSDWVKQIEESAPPNILSAVVANKSNL